MQPSFSRPNNDPMPWCRLAGWYSGAIFAFCFLILPWLLRGLVFAGVMPLHWVGRPEFLLVSSLLPAVLLLWCAAYGMPAVEPRGMLPRLGLTGFRWGHLKTGLKWFPAIYFGNIAIQMIWNLLCKSLGIEFEQPPTLQVAASSEAHFAVLAFCAVLVAPAAEEILLRGWLFGTLAAYTDFWGAALATSMFFAILHMTLMQFPCLLFLGLALQLLYWHTGSLWPGIWVHMLNNLTSVVLLVVLKAAGIEM